MQAPGCVRRSGGLFQGSKRSSSKAEKESSAFRLPEAEIALAGVTARFEAGELRDLEVEVDAPCESAAVADSGAWLEALVSGDAEAVEVEGEPALAHGIVEAVHEQLFAGLPEL